MGRLYKRYKKYFTGGGLALTQGAQAADALSPLVKKNYSQDLLDSSEEMRTAEATNNSYNQISGKVENALISSGNPYGMIGGAAIKGSRLIDQGINKAATNSFGEYKSTFGKVAGVVGKAGNPIGNIVTGVDNLDSEHLSTGEKILGFTPIGAVINQDKIAKEEKKKFVVEQSNNLQALGRENYKQALAEGFKAQGNEFANNYKYGGSLYKKMQSGGNLNQISQDNIEVTGAKHEDGGVKIPELGVELEGGETINDNYVFSEQLGFAQRHKKIAKAIGKAESKPENRFSKNTLSRLKDREDLLKIEQEEVKSALGLDDETMKQYGGKLYKTLAEDLPAGTNSVVVTKSSKRPPKYEDIKKKLEDKKDVPHYQGNTYQSVVGGKAYKYGGSLQKKMALGGPYASKTPHLDDLLAEDSPVAGALGGVSTGTKSVSNPFGGATLNSLSGLSGYADNINNFILNRQRAKEKLPDESLTTYLNPVNYDYSGQRVEADNQRRGFNKSIDANNLNVGTANTNKAIGLYQTIRAKNLINEGETNINAQERARVSTINKNIESRNNSITLANKMRKIQGRDDVRREDSANVANIVEKGMLSKRDNKMEEIMRDQNVFNVASADIRTSYPFLSSNPELAKKYGLDLEKMKREYEIALYRDKSLLSTKKYGGRLYKK